jgi:hypothetical protein
MLLFVDILLTFLHSALVIFAMTGWAFAKIRTLHFWSILCILFAWLVIGWAVGTLGYCPITDLHWDIKRALGETNLPNSFIKYMLDWVFQNDFDRKAVDQLTGIVMVMIVTITGWKKYESRWLAPA